MTAATITDRETLRQIVRGERHLSDLPALGMTMKMVENRVAVDNPRKVVTAVGIQDLAKGLLTNLGDQVRLREWALFIQAADVDFDLEGEPQGEAILAALWDAAFGNPLEPELPELLQRLASNGSEP